MQLKRRKDTVIPWVIGAGENLISYSSGKSIEGVKTRIKLLNDEDSVIAEASDTSLEEIIGMRQDIDTPDDSLSQGQISELAKSMLAEQSRPTENLTVKAIGKADVISGIGVFIQSPHLGLSKTYYVERDDHTFEKKYHTMSLSLVSAADIDKD